MEIEWGFSLTKVDSFSRDFSTVVEAAVSLLELYLRRSQPPNPRHHTHNPQYRHQYLGGQDDVWVLQVPFKGGNVPGVDSIESPD